MWGGIWIIFWGILFLGVLFNNNPANKTFFNQALAIKSFLLILAIIVLVSVINKKLKKGEHENRIYSLLYRHHIITGIAFFVILFTVQLIIIINIYQKVGWDVAASWNNAVLWHTDNALSDWALQTYPNNIGITYFMYFLQSLVSGLDIPGQYLFVVIINTLLVDFGIYITYKVSYKLKGFTVAIISTLLVTVLMGISGWIVVPYTDAVTLWIPVTIIYLYILLKENSLYGAQCNLAASGIGILSVMGYYLKPQCVIVLIAIGLEELYEYIIYKNIKKSTKNNTKKYIKTKSILKDKFVPLLAGVLIMFFLNMAVGKYVLPDDFTRDNSMPVSHFLMMGLDESPYGGLGSYSADDVFKTCDYKTKKEKKEYCQAIISKRLKNFGIAGFINHLYYKGIWVLGDGTFFWQKEAGQEFFVEDYSLNNGNLQKTIRGFYYDNSNENNKRHMDFMGIITGIWFLTLCFTVFAPLSVGKTLKNRKVAICMAVLGCVMFTLLFEGRSRYLINYIPFFAFIAATGIYDFYKSIVK